MWHMSRAPANETHNPTLNAAMSPFGVIDFVDNQCLQAQAAHAGVVGGPPAYLDAHGIRYVPTASLDASAADSLDASAAAATATSMNAVPMSRNAGSGQPEPVSQQELNNRVDERIRRFMSARSTTSTLQSLRDDIGATRESQRSLRRAAYDDEPSASYERKLDRMRQRMAEEDEDRLLRPSVRSYDDPRDSRDRHDRVQSVLADLEERDRRDRMRSAVGESGRASDGMDRRTSLSDGMDRKPRPDYDVEDLKALRREVEAAAAAAGKASVDTRKLSQSASSRVGRARQNLQSSSIDF